MIRSPFLSRWNSRTTPGSDIKVASYTVTLIIQKIWDNPLYFAHKLKSLSLNINCFCLSKWCRPWWNATLKCLFFVKHLALFTIPNKYCLLSHLHVIWQLYCKHSEDLTIFVGLCHTYWTRIEAKNADLYADHDKIPHYSFPQQVSIIPRAMILGWCIVYCSTKV